MIGRKKEVKELNQLYNSNKAELVAIYGRRRIGKTYLVDETFKGRITFRHAGLSPVDENKKGMLKAQLEHFYYSLLLQGMAGSNKPESWLEAFYMLEKFLEEKDNGTRQLIFLDELPWLDTPRSGFMTAFEGFWNTWGCHRDNLMVVVCGSANSWILDKLINNHGGLYNRVTYEIKLLPFTLNECEEFYVNNHVKLSRYDIAQSYMILGGIPYYMGYFQSGMSLAQNIDTLFFAKQAKLRDEYDRLFGSIFSHPEEMKKIVTLLFARNAGYTRREIVEKLGISDGGTLSQYLNALISSDFVIKYIPFGKGKKEHYKLIDPFCMFYLRFVDKKKRLDENFWQHNISSQQVISWRGFAYENVCFNHISQIKKALGISGVITTHSAWSKRSDDTDGAQIDLLILRNDNIINMCEIKYYGDEFVVNKDYYQVLLHRQEILLKEISPKISIHNTLITTFGLAYNEYSGVFSNVITLDDLFAE
ncbi:MAG: ATP-binding protein [Clostridiales bacterium]|nr:ATP-binding protein [Clostridiales bacterium]